MELRSLQHPLVKRLSKLRQDRRFRHEEGRVLVFGRSMVSELCQTLEPQHILLAADAELPNSLAGKPYYRVSEDILRKIAGVQSADSILVELQLPAPSSLAGAKRVLVLDGISDPGNLGTLLRTALALGWDGVFLLDGCVDPFNDKALRASKGAIFRLPYRQGSLAELMAYAEQEAMQVWVADLAGAAPHEIPNIDKMLLVLGSEAAGPCSALRQAAQPVSIPMEDSMESLNVAIAGGILMYVLGQR